MLEDNTISYNHLLMTSLDNFEVDERHTVFITFHHVNGIIINHLFINQQSIFLRLQHYGD